MARHCGRSNFNNGSLTNKSRTRKSRRNRGHRIQSRKDKALFGRTANQGVVF